MKARSAIAVIVGVLGFAGQAAVASSLKPTRGELAHARSRAVAYWRVPQPPCGRESVLTGVLPPTWSAEANFATCQIVFSSAQDWHDFPEKVCRAYVHEFGHLVLGPTYFQATNPTDPSHSLNPGSIMFRAPTWRQELFEDRVVGCVAAPRRHPHRP